VRESFARAPELHGSMWSCALFVSVTQIGRDGDMTWSVRSRDACPYVGAIVGNTTSFVPSFMVFGLVAPADESAAANKR
jgi:hypothetical protein